MKLLTNLKFRDDHVGFTGKSQTETNNQVAESSLPGHDPRTCTATLPKANLPQVYKLDTAISHFCTYSFEQLLS
jgi:hypothetical protein